MKIKPEHYAHIKSIIESMPRDKLLAHKESLKHDPSVKNLDLRFRNDLIFAVPARWICDNLYPYMDDTHLDTALRSITKELGL